uniref:Ubiquitin-like-conjugating enzyme ATG10 n=1 Tax=Cynoglossus semilaevis TaxID=244447 RepID=A0A3P8X568_CYNSE
MWLNGIFLNIHVRFCFLEILNFKQLLNVFYIVFSVCILHIYLTYILYLHSVCSDLYNLFLQSFPDASCDDDTITSKIADDDDDDDEVHIESEDICQVLQYEYHILFSCSYSTPVLYFRAFTQEGRSLLLEEVWNSVHPNFRQRLQNSPLSTISQEEHPLLGQPFFKIHPCRTEEFMRPVLQAAHDQSRPVNFVLTWLSVVGPLVGLDVPLKYSILLQSEANTRDSESD